MTMVLHQYPAVPQQQYLQDGTAEEPRLTTNYEAPAKLPPVLPTQPSRDNNIIASGGASFVTAAEVAALRAQIAAQEEQMAIWKRFMADLGAKLPDKGVKMKKSAKEGRASVPTPAAAAVGLGGRTKEVPELPIDDTGAVLVEDEVRARAVAAFRAQGGKTASPTIPEFLAGGGVQKSKRRPELEERQKKRVRYEVLPSAAHAVDGTAHAATLALRQGPSAGISEAAPSSYADVAVAALRAVMGADAEPPSSTAVQEAVRLMSPGGVHYDEAMKRNVVTAFSCAVLECAAPAPTRRLAAAPLSPRCLFLEEPTDAMPRHQLGAKSQGEGGAGIDVGVDVDGIPSFIGVWCSTEVLERHALPWLLHCAAEISLSTLNTAEEEKEGAPAALLNRRRSTGKSAAAAGGSPTALPADTLCSTVAKDLSGSVIRDATRQRPMHSPTERCAAAAAAAALWRAQGDVKALQVFLIDLLLAQPENEVEVLAPLAAAIDSWPEVVPTKGALGTGVQGLLQCACLASKRHPSLEVRVAGKWMMQLGAAVWGWSTLEKEDGTAIGVAARRKLVKFSA